MNKKRPIIAITGASGTGKTSVSIELAKKLNTEIISADSRYLYKELDICTAKPTKEEMQGIKHHFIDVCTLNEEYSAGLYKKEAEKIADNLIEQGKIPIVTGGTGLYIRAFLGDYEIPEIEPDLEYRKILENISSQELYEELKKIDFEQSKKIHPNNKTRIVRALEVAHVSGKKMSEIQKLNPSKYEVLWLGLKSSDRQFLYNILNSRVDLMFDMGLEKEIVTLIDKYGDNKILQNTIGAKEFYLKNEKTIEEIKSEIKKNTRRYAKRQISWYSGDDKIKWFDIDIIKKDEIISQMFNLIQDFIRKNCL